MKLTTYTVADIGTQHITAKDAELLGQGGTGFRVGEIDAGRGHLVLVPDDDEPAWMPQLREEGFSQGYIELLREVARQGIPYIRFDADGFDVEGAPVFDW